MSDDAVSRQAALNEFKDDALPWDTFDGYIAPHYVRKILEQLPSIQTEIIRCKECKYFGEIGCAIMIVDDSDKPTENDYCSFAERREDGTHSTNTNRSPGRLD